GGEVKIGEQHLIAAQHRDLARLRLLHLHDHVCLGEDLGGIGGNLRPGGAEMVVVDADDVAGVGFDDHAMAMPYQLAHPGRGHPDAVLMSLDLFGHADQHGTSARGYSAWQGLVGRRIGTATIMAMVTVTGMIMATAITTIMRTAPALT